MASLRRMVLGQVFGATALDDWVGNWLGKTMFFSHYDRAVTQELILDSGLLVERAEVLQQDNEDTEFLWITARNTVSVNCGHDRCAGAPYPLLTARAAYLAGFHGEGRGTGQRTANRAVPRKY